MLIWIGSPVCPASKKGEVASNWSLERLSSLFLLVEKVSPVFHWNEVFRTASMFNRNSRPEFSIEPAFSIMLDVR
ncbi:hypothetical protein FQZ97_1071470 [compost metagenome]